MLEIKDGKIYVEGVETIDPELIGMAFLDFAERLSKNTVFDSNPIFHPTKEWSSEESHYIKDEIRCCLCNGFIGPNQHICNF